MEADDPIAIVIEALNPFQLALDDTDNLYRLYQLSRVFALCLIGIALRRAMFSLLERFPDAEFGSPGPLVQELEAVRRQPTHHAQYRTAERPKRVMAVGATHSFLCTHLASDQTRLFAQDFCSY